MTALRQLLALLALAALPATGIGLFLIAPSDRISGPAADSLESGEVTLATARQWPQVLWIDARASSQFMRDHIPEALPLTEENWEADLQKIFDRWDPEKKIVVYCDSASCDTSRRIAARLREEVGLENVFALKGGWEAWEQAR